MSLTALCSKWALPQCEVSDWSWTQWGMLVWKGVWWALPWWSPYIKSLLLCISVVQLLSAPPPPCFVGSCVLGIYWDLILSAGSQHFPWKIFTRNGWGAHFPNTDRGRHVEGSFGCKQQAWALQELYDFVGITSVVVCCSEISSC